MLFLSVILSSCGNKEEDKTQKIKVSNLELSIPDWFVSSLSTSKKIWQFKIIDEYKKPSFSGFSSSLIIWEYFWRYPSDFDNFFSVVENKFLRKLPGSAVLKQWKFSLKWWIKVVYFKYSVKNNIFKKSEPDYYWLQLYILESKKIYVMNYLSSSKTDVDSMLDLFKEIKLIK